MDAADGKEEFVTEALLPLNPSSSNCRNRDESQSFEFLSIVIIAALDCLSSPQHSRIANVKNRFTAMIEVSCCSIRSGIRPVLFFDDNPLRRSVQLCTFRIDENAA